MLRTVVSIIAVLFAASATAADRPRKVWTAAEVMAVSGMTPPPAEADSPEASAPAVAAPTKTNAGATPQKRGKSNDAKAKAKAKTKARTKARTAVKAKAAGKTAKKTPSAKKSAKHPRR